MTQAPPSVLLTLVSPMLQLACDSVSSSSLVVSWTLALPTELVLTYSQYLVSGCSVTSSGVANVISWKSSVISEDVLRSVQRGLVGSACVVSSYGDLWDESAGSHIFVHIYLGTR